MAVDKPDVIDLIGIDVKSNSVILTISDHLEWDEKNEHLLILQAKINHYLAVIESGALGENYPDLKNRDIVINIAFMYSPKGEGITFLERAKEILNNAGYGFQYKIIDWKDQFET